MAQHNSGSGAVSFPPTVRGIAGFWGKFNAGSPQHLQREFARRHHTAIVSGMCERDKALHARIVSSSSRGASKWLTAAPYLAIYLSIFTTNTRRLYGCFLHPTECASNALKNVQKCLSSPSTVHHPRHPASAAAVRNVATITTRRPPRPATSLSRRTRAVTNALRRVNSADGNTTLNRDGQPCCRH